MLSELIDLVPLPDILAIIWLVVWWSGYAALNCNPQTNRRELARVIDGYRHRWMERMLERDNRMADVNIIIAHIRSGALFASTTVLILAGIVALLGNVDWLIVMIDELAFSTLASRQLIELKVQTMMAIFAYGFSNSLGVCANTTQPWSSLARRHCRPSATTKPERNTRRARQVF
ncbi:MAG: DUF599 family protein [Rhodospirillaceae bacterium]|nr:DUF599 family protein [Rhodospirillaceae bacterium]